MSTRPNADDTSPSFEDLLAPVGLAAFLNRTFRKTYMHIPGDAARGAALFDWDEMNAILNMNIWNAQNLAVIVEGKRAPPGAYCVQRADHSMAPAMCPDPERTMELLRQGASMVMEELANVAPRVAAVAAGIRQALNGHIGANLYYSQREKRAFGAHFDRHEVFAVQVYGEKRWNIYKGRADHPIEHPMFQNISR
jgi:hypothetical protein